MCRKNRLHGCCIIAFAVGLMIGHSLESWFLCCFGALGLIALGMCILKKRM